MCPYINNKPHQTEAGLSNFCDFLEPKMLWWWWSQVTTTLPLASYCSKMCFDIILQASLVSSYRLQVYQLKLCMQISPPPPHTPPLHSIALVVFGEYYKL
jgi:hypothetical protein